jgi:RND family efflux transporter MFP subunit
VKKGDLLYEIDPRPYQAALDKAEGEVSRLKAVLEKAKADLARSDRLRPSGAISEDEYEQRVSQLAIAKASIQTAEAAVRDAQLNLEFTKILSPIDGRVSRTKITEGNLVQTGTDEKTVLTTVVTVDPIYVNFNIDEAALLKYRKLTWQSGESAQPDRIKEQKIPVEIALLKEQGYPHAGVLDFLDNEVDSKTGTIRARGVFDNKEQFLTPGLFVRVRIPYGKSHEAVLVSERAIGTDQRQKYLLTVNKENVVEYNPVKLGSLHDGMRVIESGIEPESLIITNGLMRAEPGKTVQPHFASSTKGVAASEPPAKAGQSGQKTSTPKTN